MTSELVENLDINEIKKLIPHRYPFLLVDRVVSAVPGQSAKGYKNLTIEAMAQLACIALLLKDEYKGMLGVFTGIEGVKFRQMVVPGDRLDMEVELLKIRGPLGRMKAVAKVGDKVACEGEISFAMLKRED